MSLTLTINTILLATLISNTVFADSWAITQNVTVRKPLSISQINATNSTQAINTIHLDESHGAVITTQQTMNMGGSDLKLLQSGGENNRQAINYLIAPAISSATQTVNQASALSLNQQGSNNNIQALNYVKATGSGNSPLQSLNQTVEADHITLNFQGVGSGNIQAGNYLEADTLPSAAGDVIQNFTATSLNYIQSGTHNLQAGNVVIKNSNTPAGAVTQNFTAEKVSANFGSAGAASGSVTAANYFSDQP